MVLSKVAHLAPCLVPYLVPSSLSHPMSSIFDDLPPPPLPSQGPGGLFLGVTARLHAPPHRVADAADPSPGASPSPPAHDHDPSACPGDAPPPPRRLCGCAAGESAFEANSPARLGPTRALPKDPTLPSRLIDAAHITCKLTLTPLLGLMTVRAPVPVPLCPCAPVPLCPCAPAPLQRDSTSQ